MKTMNISKTFGAAILAVATVATSCTTTAGQPARGGGVYLVGVAGAGWSANAKVRAAFESIDGVESVEFDCKVATVSMEDRAVLTALKASKVMRESGFEVASFKVGEPRKVTAFLFLVNQFEPDERARLENDLRDDLKDADKITVDSLGRAAVVVSGEPATAREAVTASLKSRGVAVEGFETETWPELDATYVVAVSGMNGVVETRTVANVLGGVAKVVAVHVYQEDGKATLWLKEPCDALEANVRTALASAGFTVSRFGLTDD